MEVSIRERQKQYQNIPGLDLTTEEKGSPAQGIQRSCV